MAEVQFTLPAVHCDGCFTGIEMASRLQAGVTGVKGVPGTKQVTIAWDEQQTTEEAVTHWLKSIGYEPADHSS